MYERPHNSQKSNDENTFAGNNPFSVTQLEVGPNPAVRYFKDQLDPTLEWSYELQVCSGKLRTDGRYCSPCSQCLNGASCQEPKSYPIPAGTLPNCTCAKGWTGKFCETEMAGHCASNPCKNNGTCADKSDGGYQCTCPTGVTGKQCDSEMNDCNSKPCKNGGTCKDELNSYSCICAAGWSGQKCETDIDECDSNPCLHEGTCQGERNGYLCTCAHGWTGKRCEWELGFQEKYPEFCDPSPCKNNGTCSYLNAGYKCTCMSGFTGIDCEQVSTISMSTTTYTPSSSTIETYGKYPFNIGKFINRIKETGFGNILETKDWCSPNPCPNGGVCINIAIGYICDYDCMSLTVYPGSCRKEANKITSLLTKLNKEPD